MSGPVAGYLNSVRGRTDATTAGTVDALDGIKDVTVTFTADMLETTNFKPGTGVKTRIGGLQDTGADIGGDFIAADAPQQLIRNAWLNRSAVYLTFLADPTATALSKGWQIPMLVQEYSEKSSPGGLVEFSAKLVGNGAPVAV